jgi:hypothetical protein
MKYNFNPDGSDLIYRDLHVIENTKGADWWYVAAFDEPKDDMPIFLMKSNGAKSAIRKAEKYIVQKLKRHPYQLSAFQFDYLQELAKKL